MKGTNMPTYNTHEIPIPEDYEVYWEYWTDAYNNKEEEDKISEKLKKEVEFFQEAEEMMDEPIEELQFFEKPIKTVFTPFGILPVTENSLASSKFKFWIGHTNFKILESFVKVIENCNGVESIDVLTPYRFRLGIGKLFMDNKVKSEVRQSLINIMRQYDQA